MMPTQVRLDRGCLHAWRPSEGAPAPSSSLSCPRSWFIGTLGTGAEDRQSGSRAQRGGGDSLNLPTPGMGGRWRPSFYQQGQDQRKIRMRPLFKNY